MEEDTGKLTHVGASGRINAADHALVDYNRSGVPLVEIVSEPDIRSVGAGPGLRQRAAGDPGGDRGLRRADGGGLDAGRRQRVGPAGSAPSAFGTRCEIKNLNSLRSLGRAIEYEAARQIALLEAGGVVEQETRHWDESAGRTESMRSKEEANDYRYFPEPDLVPLAPDAAWQDRVRASLGPMPADRRAALATALGGDAERGRGRPDPRRRRPGARHLGDGRDGGGGACGAGAGPRRQRGGGPERGRPAARPGLVRLPARHGVGWAALGDAVQGGARQRCSIAAGETRPPWPRRWASRPSASDTLGEVLDGVIAAHPDEWARFMGGDDGEVKKLSGFFTGKVMQVTSGKANGKEVAAELDRRRRAPAGG